MTLTITHLAVGMVLAIVGSIGTLWTTWVRPAHRKEVDLQIRLTQIEGRLDAGDKRFDTMEKLEKDMRAVLDRLTAIETLMKAQGGIPDQ